MKSPFFRRTQALKMCIPRQILAQHIIQIRIQSSPCYLSWILQLQCTACRVSRVRKQRLFLFLSLFVQRLKPLPRQQYFASQLKERRYILSLNLPRDRRDRLDIIDHVIALLSVPSCQGFHQHAMFVPKRNRKSIVFQFANDLYARR